ncbi:MAG: hypothetical protein RJA36_1345 [Pseudomonadota bacterium]|jgi:hypothetical protein
MKHFHPEQQAAGSRQQFKTGARRLTALGVLAASGLAVLALSAWSGQQTRQMAVSATVQPYARLTVQQPAQLVATTPDIAQGYIDVANKNNPSGGTLTVRSNDRAGHTLIFSVPAAQQAMYTSIQINGLGQPLTLPPTGGQVSLPYTGPVSNYTLSYRFNMPKATPSVNSNASKSKQPAPAALQVGNNPWPLTVTVQPN